MVALLSATGLRVSFETADAAWRHTPRQRPATAPAEPPCKSHENSSERAQPLSRAAEQVLSASISLCLRSALCAEHAFMHFPTVSRRQGRLLAFEHRQHRGGLAAFFCGVASCWEGLRAPPSGACSASVVCRWSWMTERRCCVKSSILPS